MRGEGTHYNQAPRTMRSEEIHDNRAPRKMCDYYYAHLNSVKCAFLNFRYEDSDIESPPSDDVMQNTKFYNFDRYIGPAILNFEFLMYANSGSETPKTPEWSFLCKFHKVSQFRPPYWVTHFEFSIFNVKFGISNPENLYISSSMKIR